MRRKGFSITGRVQGVGFRPFVFRLASRYGLSGMVRNDPEGVIIEAQGNEESLRAFSVALRAELPPLARVTSWAEKDLPLCAEEAVFSIVRSSNREGKALEVLVSPDMAVCPDCLRDISDPKNRRYRYPFTNCTNCGPRYSLTAGLPYDRERTSMACFPLCPECAREYADPADRRFHAQPNACPRCGPHVWLTEADGGAEAQSLYKKDAALRELARRILDGQIAAVKGLGGFHLVCDALNARAVDRLRQKKHRPHKPLAIIAADLADAARLVRLGEEECLERTLLESPERPIVLCPRLAGSPVSEGIAPDTRYIGVMLPCTPLHHLLLEDCAALRRDGLPTALVMTSGNREDEPIALGNREALRRLKGLADCFLLHNRDILVRVDDSVIRTLPGGEGEGSVPLFLRRARGFVPAPLPLPFRKGSEPCVSKIPAVLSLGADLKNTLCLNRGREAFVSQHIGELQNPGAGLFQEECARHLSKLLRVDPRFRMADAHPDFAGAACREDLPLQRLPHHWSHALAVLAEHGRSGPALVLALDGAGFAPVEINPTRTVWGGELLFVEAFALGKAPEITRLGSLAPLALPGGEAAIRSPWRIAHALCLRLGLFSEDRQNSWIPPWIPQEKETARLLLQMLEKNLNTPYSSGAGRLFDAVSALLGLCLHISYEGQAAVRLEEAQYEKPGAPCSYQELYAEYVQGRARPLPLELVQQEGTLRLDTPALFLALYEQARSPLGAENPARIARVFHWSLAEGLADLALAGSRITGVREVGLSGGVMQNISLHRLLRDKLRERGLTPLSHQALPPGDGCIAYGQTVWAAAKLGSSV